jgi:predicted nuclease of predicted toxin-antitoxin system
MGRFKKYKWRFYADNNIDREIVEFLRGSDIDVLWIAEVPELKKQQDDTFHYHKAAQLGRYLLTRDLDFWDDQRHSLAQSPGVIIIATRDAEIGKYLPLLLRTLLVHYNPLPEPLHLGGVKIKLDANGMVVRMLDHDTQKVTSESWAWTDLI